MALPLLLMGTAMATDVALIVEDMELLRGMYGEMLQEMGLAVVLAESAETAIALLEHRNVTILLSDLALGEGMNGVELAQLASEKHPEVRVIIMSGYASAHGLPANVAFLEKPCSYATLQAAIERRAA